MYIPHAGCHQTVLSACRNGHAESPLTHDPVAKSAERVKRLKILVQLRKLYRNLLRAERLLATASPVHQKPADVKPVKGTRPSYQQLRSKSSARIPDALRKLPDRCYCHSSSSCAASVGKKSKQPPLLEDIGEEQEMLEAAVEVVAEMQLTAEELKVC